LLKIMTDREGLQDIDYHALAEFRYQIRRFLRFSEEVAREAELEPRQHQLMLAVKGADLGEAPHIGYLAEKLQVRHHSAVELVDRLAKRGLVQRIRDRLDRREVHVRLTARGERTLAALTLHTSAELRSAAPALVRSLRRVMAGLQGNHHIQRRPASAAKADLHAHSQARPSRGKDSNSVRAD
jgi:DNA-binding MarR family transcriptional regulator